jgi:hypothetical protein
MLSKKAVNQSQRQTTNPTNQNTASGIPAAVLFL